MLVPFVFYNKQHEIVCQKNEISASPDNFKLMPRQLKGLWSGKMASQLFNTKI